MAIALGLVVGALLIFAVVPFTSRGIGTAPKAPGSDTAATPEQVSSPIEQEVLSTTWAGFTSALANGDHAALSHYATTQVQDVEWGNSNCGCTTWLSSWTQVSFSVPPVAVYPISFLAEFQGQSTDNAPYAAEVVFSQSSTDASWLVSHVGGFNLGYPFFDSPTDVNTVAPTLPVDLEKAPGAYSTFFQHLDTTGGTDQPLPTGYHSGNLLNSLIQDAQSNWLGLHQAGLRVTYTHTVDAVSPEFALETEGQVYGAQLCFTIQETDDVTAGRGTVIVQTADRQQWGSLLAPGEYSRLEIATEFDVCLYEPLDGHLFLSTFTGGSYHFDATRAAGGGSGSDQPSVSLVSVGRKL